MANLPDIGIALQFIHKNIKYIPPDKYFAHIDLDPICLFLDGHEMGKKAFVLQPNARSESRFRRLTDDEHYQKVPDESKINLPHWNPGLHVDCFDPSRIL